MQLSLPLYISRLLHELHSQLFSVYILKTPMQQELPSMRLPGNAREFGSQLDDRINAMNARRGQLSQLIDYHAECTRQVHTLKAKFENAIAVDTSVLDKELGEICRALGIAGDEKLDLEHRIALDAQVLAGELQIKAQLEQECAKVRMMVQAQLAQNEAAKAQVCQLQQEIDRKTSALSALQNDLEIQEQLDQQRAQNAKAKEATELAEIQAQIRELEKHSEQLTGETNRLTFELSKL